MNDQCMRAVRRGFYGDGKRLSGILTPELKVCMLVCELESGSVTQALGQSVEGFATLRCTKEICPAKSRRALAVEETP